MTTADFETLRRHIQALNDSDALELNSRFCEDGSQQILLPYMMNDALEYYLVLENCRLTGSVPENNITILSAELIQEPTADLSRCALIIHYDSSQVFTIWFDDVQIIRQCYQYHQIGHFWVKGQEQWRRLVYIIGTMYDKLEYIGPEVCNDLELELLPLMEFAPFRRWFPLHAIPTDEYPDTARGCQCMKQLALEADDSVYARLISVYEKLPFPFLANILANALTSPKRLPLYEILCQKVQAASECYPVRDYGPELNAEIARKREQVTQLLHENGFTGEYPLFEQIPDKNSKTDSKTTYLQVFAMEEHPFTVLESDTFQFRIQFMVSECRKAEYHITRRHSVSIYGSTNGLNAGFFKKSGYRGWIEKEY